MLPCRKNLSTPDTTFKPHCIRNTLVSFYISFVAVNHTDYILYKTMNPLAMTQGLNNTLAFPLTSPFPGDVSVQGNTTCEEFNNLNKLFKHEYIEVRCQSNSPKHFR